MSSDRHNRRATPSLFHPANTRLDFHNGRVGEPPKHKTLSIDKPRYTDTALPPFTLPSHRYDQSSYYTRANVQSAALLRARRPYLVKNAIAGIALFGITAGICRCPV